MKTIIFAASILALVSGCAQSSGSTYKAADVGRTIETQQGSVVASRVVDVSGEASAAGPLAGAAVGAGSVGIATSGSGVTGFAALLGAVAGAGAGYLAEQELRSGEGIEYIVQMDDGRTVTIVQNREDEEVPIPNGSPVLVQYGADYTRVSPVPASMSRPGSTTWIDPDTIGVAPASGAMGEPFPTDRPASGPPGDPRADTLGDPMAGTPGDPSMAPGAGNTGYPPSDRRPSSLPPEEWQQYQPQQQQQSYQQQ